MRFRYFTIISIVLFATSVITILGLYYIQVKDRKEAIDSRLYATTQILLSSDIIDKQNINMKRAEQILELEVGQGQSENFFLVRNVAGTILYKYNIQASEFEYIPLTDNWHTVNHPDKYIRVLNLSHPQLNDRSLQVGVIVSKDLVFPRWFSNETLFTLLITNGIGLLLAWILANFLTRPIRQLSEILNKNARFEKGQLSIDIIPEKDFRTTQGSRDELHLLVIATNELISRVNRGLQLSRLWTYQMSHEIKTPLTIMNGLLQQNKSQLPDELNHHLQTQIFKISETVNAFLSWAEAQNIRPSISHVVRLSRLVHEVIDKVKLRVLTPIEVDLQDDIMIGINYNQMEQVLSNLLVNAFEHGDQKSHIQITAQKNILTVSNAGAAFPPQILQNLGAPFNKEPSTQSLFQGTGLGLAYVYTVCEMNDFPLNIAHENGRTSVSIDLTKAIQN